MARTNGGIIGVKNSTSQGGGKQTLVTSTSNLCTQPGTRIVQALLVAGGGSGGGPPGGKSGNGGSGQAHTFGFNHYFNSNVRLMAEYAYGDYGSNNDNGMRESTISTLQARLHLKY